jgi:hypothetical protein
VAFPLVAQLQRVCQDLGGGGTSRARPDDGRARRDYGAGVGLRDDKNPEECVREER